MKRYEKVKNQEQKSKSRAKIKIKSKNQKRTFSGGIRLLASMIKCTNEYIRLRLVQGRRSRALLPP
jgi:hypothetical protein